MCNNPLRRLILSVACASLPLFAAPAPAQEKDNLETQYGDIHITRARKLKGKGDFSGVQIIGPQTLVTVPYPRSHSELVLHADDIVTRAEGGDQFAHATLTGNVRYTMTQNVSKGVTRVVTGTAERAIFNHKMQRIEMDGSVQVNLTDPERLAAPGTIRAGRAVVEMDKSPYLYTLTGNSAANEITFTPKADTPKPGEKQKANGVGAVRVSGYDKGTFQVGQNAHFEGDNTTAEMTGKDELSRAEIRAETFDADFTAARSALKIAKAEGKARFHISRPAAVRGKNAPQNDDIAGHCDAIEYDAAAAKFTLIDHVDADILAPGTLTSPAKIKVDRLIAHVAAPYSYELKSAAQDSLIRFTPVPSAPLAPKTNNSAPKPDAPAPKLRLAVGAVTISRFDYGNYQPGKSLSLTVAQGKVRFQSDDAATQTSSYFLARAVTADIAATNQVTAAKAAGEVEFRVRQAVPDTKIAQAVEGTAPEILFVGGADERSMTMPGPFHVIIADPSHLVQPGNITGATGDKLIVTLTGTTYNYELQSDKETAQVDLVPIPREKKPANPAPAKKSDSKGKKVSGR